MEQDKNVLISGASFAGLTTAFWMNKMGYKVTIIEIGKQLKRGGSPVNIKDSTVDIVRRMGIFEQIKSHSIGPEKWEFKNAEDISEHTVILKLPDERLPDNDFEIERDLLLSILFDLIKNDVHFIFSNSIAYMQENKDGVEVAFKDGTQSRFEFVFGCDGLHSAVRKIWFGDETNYAHFFGQYFSIGIVNKLLVEEGTFQMYAEPNKSIGLYAYNHKTDIIFMFRPEKEIMYDYRNQEQHKKIIAEQFEEMKWRTAELQQELLHAASFYFDKFSQVKMPSWTKGRVALVGDAGYCASPAAGMGGSLAIIGATALADAFEKHNGNFELAFEEYNKDLRPFIQEVQSDAIGMLDKLVPKTEEEIKWRNQHGFAF